MIMLFICWEYSISDDICVIGDFIKDSFTFDLAYKTFSHLAAGLSWRHIYFFVQEDKIYLKKTEFWFYFKQY